MYINTQVHNIIISVKENNKMVSANDFTIIQYMLTNWC